MDSDASLERLAHRAVRSDERLVTSGTRVRVHARSAFLTGIVPRLSLRTACEDAVSSVPGITAIINDIAIDIPAVERTSDEGVRRAALARIALDDRLVNKRIDVVVHDGWLWLEGVVADRSHWTAAQRAVECAVPIRGLSNLLRLEPRPVPRDVQDVIDRALARELESHAPRIRVEVAGAVAFLHGWAPTIRARRAAEECAWMPGIRKVENRIQIQE